MHRPRRKPLNTINAPALARSLVIIGFIGLAGLIYVYLTVQLVDLGDRKKALENELAAVRAQNELASGQIAALTSRPALERRLKEGHLRLVPITDLNIVRLNFLPSTPGEDDAVQPVVNPRSGR